MQAARSTYTFNPTTSGAKSSSTTIGIDGENFAITMSGTALFPLTVAPTTLSFPDTYVNATSSIAVVITNVSGVSQLRQRWPPNDPVNFGGSQNCAGVTLAPNTSSSFTYTFNPTTSGAKSEAPP